MSQVEQPPPGERVRIFGQIARPLREASVEIFHDATPATSLKGSISRLTGCSVKRAGHTRTDFGAYARHHHGAVRLPERTMRAFIVRPTKTAKRGRIMSQHEGEEILFILTGRIELVIGKRKETLNPGDCIQFDSTISDKLTQVSSEPASALVVIATKTT